jgi:tRNA pseudouridine55 synthase
MKNIINLYKPVGMTPLQALGRFKLQNARYRKEKISYPGRLDPMAQGVLLLLVGDENKKMVQYMGLDKEYVAKILLGFSSDSYDILGVAERGVDGRMVGEKGGDVKENILWMEINERLIKKTLQGFKGQYNQKLPAYSSYKIKGKSLFYYAREGKLDEVKIPRKDVRINKIRIEGIYKIGSGKLLREIREKIGKVDGDFRQDEILKKWDELLRGSDEKYLVVEVTIGCSSGTYIRAIANEVGEKLGSGGLLLDLVRTRVGEFDLKNSMKIL